MANTRRNTLAVIGAVAISGLWASPARARSAQVDEAPTAIVRIDNHAMVPANVLEQAEQRMADVYKMIGVHLSFLDERQAIQDQAVVNYTMVFLPSPTVGLDVASEISSSDVMGQALKSAGRAYVFYSRVSAAALNSDRDLLSLLGDVMAHELGHLMLPAPGHSEIGIMRPNANMRSSRMATFTSTEAAAIRLTLRGDIVATVRLP